jgi:hypothetical protein
MSITIKLTKRVLGYRAGTRAVVVAINEPGGVEQVADATAIMPDDRRAYLLPDEYIVLR